MGAGPGHPGGRAVVTFVPLGMLERPFPPGIEWPAPQTVAFRDLMIRHATEMRLTLDYVLGLPDYDEDRLVYTACGPSFRRQTT